jgi:hypothetical protein
MKRMFLFGVVLTGFSVLLAGCGTEGGGVAQSARDGDRSTAGDDFGDASAGDASASDGAAAHSYDESFAAPAHDAPAASREPTLGPSGSSRAETTSGLKPRSAPPAGSTTSPAAPPGDAASAPDETPAPGPPRSDPSRREGKGVEKPARPERPQIQSGLLTAGSFDDNERFADYQKYISKVLQHDSSEAFPRFAVGERVVIQVADEQGRPVGGARVVVQATDQARGELLRSVTGSDGRIVFCTALDKAAGQQVFQVRVTPAGGAQKTTVTETLKLDERPWRITLKGVEAELPKQLDLALVIDTTGSMSDELEYLKVEIDSIVASVSRMFPDVDQRYALVVYRDQGDEYVTRTFDFTGSLKDFRDDLSAQFAGGGGDYPEAVHLAVEHAGKLSWRQGNTARVMFLVGDAPPHNDYLGVALDAAQTLRRDGVRIYPLGGSGVGHMAQFIFRAMSFATMGQYLFLTDHSGIGNPHATPDVPEFQVERLDRLMLRMISSELAGKRLAPQEVIAIERGELDADLPPQLEPQQRQQQPIPPPAVVHPAIEQQPAAAPAAETEAAAKAASASSSTSRSSVLPSLAGSWLPWLALGLVVAGIFAADALRDRRK